jgi:acetyl esterase/lipase
VLALDYRLAPEHSFPAALDDVCAAARFLRARAADYGMDAAKLAICGDSAGGTLAAAACQAAARAQDPPLALQVLLCPILDYSRRSGSRVDFASGYLLDQATLDHDLRHCMPGGADAMDARLSPLRAADLSGVPRTIVHTAEFDPLRDEGRDYFERLAHTATALSYTCHAGMIHLFYGLGGVIPYARTALEQIGREIRAALA